MNKTIATINGNIGAGKTTFTNLLKEYFSDSEIVEEPVSIWKGLVDENEKNILDKFYEDPERYAYLFQNLAYISRIEETEKAIRKSKASILFFDRSPQTDKHVFEKMLYDSKKISTIEHNIYNYWYDFCSKYVRPESQPNIIIYLRCSPETAYQRIMKRNRPEEKNITIEYLSEVHRYHEEWLNDTTDGKHVITIDCNRDFESDISYQIEIMEMVKLKIAKIILETIFNKTNELYYPDIVYHGNHC